MTPDAFSGLWRRRSLQLGGAVPSEPAAVRWIQWGDHYLDVRLPAGEPQPFCGPGTFGGTTSWSEPVLTWHHTFDSQPGGAADEGTVRWLGDDLLEEHGVAVLDAVEVPYVEVWARVGPRPTTGRHWSPASGAIAIEAGPHRMAAAVGDDGAWAAGRSARDDAGSWRLVETTGDTDLIAVLRPALRDRG